MAKKNLQHQGPYPKDSLSARYKDIGIKAVAAANVALKAVKDANNPESFRDHNHGRRKSTKDESEK